MGMRRLRHRGIIAGVPTAPAVGASNALYGAGGGAIAAFNPTTGSAAWIAATGGTHWQSPSSSQAR